MKAGGEGGENQLSSDCNGGSGAWKATYPLRLVNPVESSPPPHLECSLGGGVCRMVVHTRELSGPLYNREDEVCLVIVGHTLREGVGVGEEEEG